MYQKTQQQIHYLPRPNIIHRCVHQFQYYPLVVLYMSK
jgi:hypothetical protein